MRLVGDLESFCRSGSTKLTWSLFLFPRKGLTVALAVLYRTGSTGSRASPAGLKGCDGVPGLFSGCGCGVSNAQRQAHLLLTHTCYARQSSCHPLGPFVPLAECPVTWLHTGLCLTWGGNAPYLEIADTGAASRDSLCHCPVPYEQRTLHQAPVCCDASQSGMGCGVKWGHVTPTLGLGFPFLVPSLSAHPQRCCVLRG